MRPLSSLSFRVQQNEAHTCVEAKQGMKDTTVFSCMILFPLAYISVCRQRKYFLVSYFLFDLQYVDLSSVHLNKVHRKHSVHYFFCKIDTRRHFLRNTHLILLMLLRLKQRLELAFFREALFFVWMPDRPHDEMKACFCQSYVQLFPCFFLAVFYTILVPWVAPSADCCFVIITPLTAAVTKEEQRLTVTTKMSYYCHYGKECQDFLALLPYLGDPSRKYKQLEDSSKNIAESKELSLSGEKR